MCDTKIPRTVFVDTFFGDDDTGQLECLDLPFQTLDAAYQALPATRSAYTVSLANGVYQMTLDLYENISITSTLNDSTSPILILTEKEISWNGVIVNACDIFLIQTPNAPFRPPLKIIGASRITSSCRLSAENLDFEESAVAKTIQSPTEPILERTHFLIENLSSFLIESFTEITITSFEDDDVGVVGFVDNRNGNAVMVPPNLETKRTLLTVVDTDHQAFFTGSADFSVTDEFLFILIINNPQLRAAQRQAFTPAPLSLVDVFVRNFVTELTRGILSTSSGGNRVSARTIQNTNALSEQVTEIVQNRLENVQNAINNRLTQGESPPLVGILNSNITSENTLSLIDNTLDYLYDQGNTSGFILPSNHTNGYPVIDVGDKEGSNIKNGSTFTRYRLITTDYIHDAYDGTVFLIDAAKEDITIKIPPSDDDHQIWNGRQIIYKRIDHSCNTVKIVNCRGKFDKTLKTIHLRTCKCKNTISALEIILDDQGDAFILNSFGNI